jgi:uncharacterized protein (TIGR02271 family)
MSIDRTTLSIGAGQDVYGADGNKVGSVSALEGDYIVVSKGFFFPTDYYIPTSAINTADADGVYLNVTKDEALNQGWDTAPAASGDTYLEEPVVDAGLRVDNPVPETDTWETTTDTRVDDSDGARLELAEEELTAQTRPVERGAVHVGKLVTEEEQTLEVPVSEERVNVTRRVVDREVAPGDAVFDEATIDVPVRGEEVDVQNRARVREEIEIDKDVVTNTEQVRGTVRREEAHISDDTGTVVDADQRPIR